MRKIRGVVTRLRHMLALRHHFELLYNIVGTHVPSHRLRLAWLRRLGARVGDNVAIFRGTTVLQPSDLSVGDNCSIGWRCVLDARGGLSIGSNVSIASDSRLITAKHDINDPEFPAVLEPIVVGDRVWIATAALVLCGVTLEEGAVVAAGSVVTRDVEAYCVVGGAPARVIAKRATDQHYTIDFRPKYH